MYVFVKVRVHVVEPFKVGIKFEVSSVVGHQAIVQTNL